jgi:hypothetical protein
MTDSDEQGPWEGRLTHASFEFGRRCRELHDSNPYSSEPNIPPVLVQVMGHLATELWDQRFSQVEIKQAFDHALADLATYCTGEERRDGGE